VKHLFPGYYRPDDDTLQGMMRSATVILDSSALLNLYRYPSQARKDLFSVLNAMSDRLWIPHQVAVEFQQNRPIVIAEQIAGFHAVREVIQQSEQSFLDKLEQLHLEKRHSAIDPKRFVDRISRAFKDFQNNLATSSDGIPT
jgi:PIN like domain